jgi:acyl-CoA reductase-like NAD-dependent aldehyde dehydrogenase
VEDPEELTGRPGAPQTFLPVLGPVPGGGCPLMPKTLVDHKSAVDDRVLGKVGLCGAPQIEHAIQAAVAARAACAATTTGARSEILGKVADILALRKEEIARIIALEVAKPIALARIEAERAASTFRDAAHVAATAEGSIVPLDVREGLAGKEALVKRVPAGVVAAITPFNFPLNLVAHKVAPAIAAGCPVIVKPAPAAPLAALLLGDLVRSCGWPNGGIQVVPVESDELTRALVVDERVRVLSFTGSAAVGWALRDQARGKIVALELGGNGMAIVHADADVAHAAERLAFGAFAYAGQVCIKAQHLLVHESVAKGFTERFVAAAKAFPAGDPLAEGVFMGPVLRDRDADRIERWIAEAKGRGAEVLCGGTRRGRTIAPTVMRGVPEDVALGCEEVFGPVAAIETYGALDDAIARVNRSRYGLQAGVFTKDVATLRRLFASLEVGAVIANDSPSTRVDPMPYGGVKLSGLGREGARYAMTVFSETRALVW